MTKDAATIVWFAGLVAWYLIRRPFERRAKKLGVSKSLVDWREWLLLTIALFGLLLAPLAGLAKALPWLAEHGISGIGLAPAIIALVLYSLLPLVRSVIAGLNSVSSAVIESARGMGMNRLQVFYKVQIPIALPVILSGIRIVAVQTVGMAVVAALIGAGGFGAIVFQGLLSSALDLVLLGVIPVVLMAVIVDGIFKFLVSMLETSRR